MNKSVDILKKLILYHEKKSYDFILPEEAEKKDLENNIYNKETNNLLDNISVFPSLNVNLDFIKVKFNSLINSDINIREFTLIAQNKEYKAFLVYIDGMVNSELINDFILKPLMLRNKANTFDDKSKNFISTAIAKNISVRRKKNFNLEEYIYNSLIPQNSIEKSKDFNTIISKINSGNCALFIDTLNTSFTIEVKGFKHRSISQPTNEVIVRGSQEGFVEVLRVNTSMLRRLVNNENLIIEKANIGNISKTDIAICYMKNITNDDLIAEVKYRIKNLDIDYILSAGQLEHLIQDDPNTAFPQMISTERPDKAANHLLEGRVVVLVNGTPYSLIMPGILLDYMASPEDSNLKFQYSNLLKAVRILGFIITLLLPAFYISITNYHTELMPTELLFAIAGSREAVPFPVIFEILIMEISFELIREASLRVPSPIGPTLGIIGALILGEASVSANIISPILIIIVAVTGISSFTIPDYSLSFTLRIFRFVYIFLSFFAGFLGISLGLFIQFIVLTNLRSFGVPYLAPYLPLTNINTSFNYFIHPFWKQETRPDFLNTKKSKSQNHISMLWKKDKDT